MVLQTLRFEVRWLPYCPKPLLSKLAEPSGKPIQNAFVESLNGKLRDACLNEYWFTSIADAQQTIER
ncbi:MAG: transposase [Acidobacteria bacterium]|nr:transposase [Acidobacteriota bacterium]